MPYQRKEVKFASRGIQVAKPADLLSEQEQPVLSNMRALQQGTLTSRPGMTVVGNASLSGNVHSLIRLNNSLPTASQSFARFRGVGIILESDDATHTVFNSCATGFSGLPLQFVIVRPNESPEPWLYVSDVNKSGKVNVSGTFRNHGIAPPTAAPYAQPAATSKQVISDFEAVGAWANGGTAGAITLVTRITTTITKIIFDSGIAGWATVQPATLDEAIQPGMLLIVNAGAETVLVESVSEAVTDTTISSISYDNGTGPGACTIQLSAPNDSLSRDSMLRIDSGGGGDEVVRVLSVTPGPGGLPSFRCTTVNTQSAGKTITGLRSFRAFFTINHAAGETLTSGNLESTITVGTGYITLTGVLDLSVVNNRPVTDEDVIHISIKIDNIDRLTEGRIAFDVDRNTNDFTQNYLYKPFRANDLSPATTGSITTLAAQQRVIQRDQIDQTGAGSSSPDTSGGPDLLQVGNFSDKLTSYYIPPKENYFTSRLKCNVITWVDEFGNVTTYDPLTGARTPTLVSQTTLGASQWTELRFKVKDLIRVGSDTARGLHDVAAIRIQLQVTDTVVLDVDAWWIGGTYGGDIGPDVGVGAPYNYRYVYRSQATGATSNPSPPMRQGIVVQRQSISGTVTPSTDPQVDQIDIYRTGGALITSDNTPPWFYVMSVPNSSPSFTDVFPDDVVIRNPQLNFDNFQPFLDADTPHSGVVNVVGTEVSRVSGDNFNTAWPAGTIMVINNVPYTLYVQPSSTTALSLNENAGTLTGVSWFITSPRLMGQKLPAMWGPFNPNAFLGGDTQPVLFACGSVYQPGKVFWTLPGNPDANGQYCGLELTSPSEPLMNGVVFRSQAFVFSSESLYVLQPTIINGDLRFTGAKVAGNRGLFGRYALCVGDEGIFYLSRDGIYLTEGSQSVSLTDEMLYPLFPHEGSAGALTNGFYPPDFTQPQYLRLTYGESELYFDYKDTNGNFRTLLYDVKVKGWFPYSYTPSVLIHYVEEGSNLNSMLLGGSDGNLYRSGGTTDGASAISCVAYSNWFDNGDPRANKQWANGMLDYVGSPSVAVYADNAATLLNTLTPATKAARGQAVLDFEQVVHRNLQLQITGNAPLTLYGYSMNWTPVSVSELNEQRNAYATSLIFKEYGQLFYAEISHSSTADLILTVSAPDGSFSDSYTIPNGGGVFTKTWVVLAARKSKLFDFRFVCGSEFWINPQQSIVLGKEWRASGPFQVLQPFGDTTFA